MSPRTLPRAVALAACAWTAGCCCFPERDDEQPKAIEPDPGWVLYTDLEHRLERAKTLALRAELSAGGAVEAAVRAELFLGEGARARLAAKGTFQGRPVDVLYVCDGTSAWVRGASAGPAPAEVRDALVRGLVAMGLMHNVAVLVGGEGPDHADGGVRDFVKADRPRMAPEGLAIDLDVLVRNQKMGEARLVLDAEGKPKERTQTVELSTGEMVVHERYAGVVLDAPLDDALFAIPERTGPAAPPPDPAAAAEAPPSG